MATKKPVALVTGGSRGIGRGICLELAKLGYFVVVNYRSNLEAAETTREMIEKAGGQADLCQGNVAEPAHRDLIIDFVMDNCGRIDLLVNNAGIAPAERRDILETTEASFDRVLAVNLKGPYFLTQRVGKLMIGLLQAGTIEKAQIVNISSISAYAVSTNLGVYEVRPGITATDMTAGVKEKYDKLIKEGLTPIHRWGRPEDVGKAVAMIARGDLPFSTGEVINVDGGFHIRIL